MKVYIAESVFGLFALDPEGNLLNFSLFPEDVSETAQKIIQLQEGLVIEDLETLLEAFQDKDVTFILEDEVLARNLKDRVEVKIEFEKPSSIAKIFRKNLLDYVNRAGRGVSEPDFKKFLWKVNTQLTRLKIKEEGEKRDKMIVQAVFALDDIDNILNLFSTRIREWYSLHFPELDKMISSHLAFVSIVSEIGLRSNYTLESLENLSRIPDKLSEEIVNEADKSMGAEISGYDIKILREFAEETVRLFELRREIERYISEMMKEVAPNVNGIIGPLLGARLISLSGGINELARLPSSITQILGAEKALFRHKKTGAPPPKHGVIFRHPEINTAPWWQRGKIARIYAGKLAIAARIDAFSGEYVAEELKEDINQRIAQIKTKYPNPPARKPKQFVPRARRKGRVGGSKVKSKKKKTR
ncbi:MAG: C/D box methylation guide ribonucleoprotein complex aNOP56 subunit [Candidatus Jordarchaeum sp.]|uniref:C/D box methylation guide ribonucleoprotein complex aNOP56 subunit n=1 Tax=Candidatus Jordarchaeum sp. TaxID=2823881 RepID=UPI00404954D0